MKRIAVVVLALVAMAGCKTKIDEKKAEALIKGMLAEQGINARPACPTGLDAKKDAKFQCTALDDLGDTLTINVTILDDEGTVNAVLAGTIVDTEALLPDIRKTIGNDALTMTCASKTVVVTQQRPAKCKVTLDGLSREMEITETDPDKHLVNWKIAGDAPATP